MSANSEAWPRPHRLTVDDYYRMAEAGLLSPDDRTELIEGEILDMPPIGSRHAAIVTAVCERLIRAVDDSVQVRSQAPVRFAPRSETQPDIALVKRRADGYRTTHPTAADVLLIVEVSESTLRFDLGVKSRLYAMHGIPEYWVVDLLGNRVCRHRRPSGTSYVERDDVSAGALPLPLPGIEIEIGDLF
jgi:Uma2 family endonuclease